MIVDFLYPWAVEVIRAPLLSLGALYLAWMLIVFVHETGHILMANIVGAKVTGFMVGRPVLIRFSVRQIRYLFGPFPSGLASYEYEDDTLRWKIALVALSGVLMEALVCVVLFLTAREHLATQLYILLSVANIIGNLFPWPVKTDGRKVLMHLNAIRQGRYTLDS